MNKKLPSRASVNEIVLETLKNAHDLLDEATILFKYSKFPRSFALSQFCLEELGKACLYVDVLNSRDEDWYEDRWNTAMAMMYDHKLKLVQSSFLHYEMRLSKLKSVGDSKKKFDLLNTILPSKEEIEAFNKLKNNSLYVGYKKGKLITLSKEIDLQLAKKRLNLAKKINEWCQRVFKEDVRRNLKENHLLKA
ncbi:AbiV family abortive infection protein [Maribacter algicola]|uniref:AbiV family abortive infection protein n=1 Tax=Meishania litoralis TaxID=3434685 RepID=A0ACC7LGL7_9FLAO